MVVGDSEDCGLVGSDVTCCGRYEPACLRNVMIHPPSGLLLYSEDGDNIGASPQHYEAWRHRRQLSLSSHCGFSRILTHRPTSHLCHDKEAPKLCPRTELNLRYKNKTRQKLMEHQQCSSSKNSFLFESNVHIVLGQVATFIVW